MVAFAKPHRKTLTPDRSAKDSGYRYYSPEISRWLSRDPVRTDGALKISRRGSVTTCSTPSMSGIVLYRFAENEPIRTVDMLGLFTLGPQGTTIIENIGTSWGTIDYGAIPNLAPPMTLLLESTQWESQFFVASCIGIYTHSRVEHLSPCHEEGERIYFADLKAFEWKPEVVESVTTSGNIITSAIVRREVVTIARFTAKCTCFVNEGALLWKRTEFHPWDECVWQTKRREERRRIISWSDPIIL